MRILTGLVAAWLCVALPAGAAVLITDDFAANANGWLVQADATVGTATREGISQGARGGDPAALLFGITANVAGMDADFISETFGGGGENDDVVTAFRAGTTQNIQFQFYANADSGGNGGGIVSPAALFLYFGDSAGNYWYYDILGAYGAPGAAGWYSYSANVSFAAGWDSDTRVEGQFVADMASAQEVGIWITYQDWSGQQYGLDDFTLNGAAAAGVPEPGMLMVMAFAAVSMVVPFRRDLRRRLLRCKV